MSGSVTDCMYYQLMGGKCAKGSRCFFYHRQLEPDICRSFLFKQCKYANNPRRCSKRHVTARDLPSVSSKEKERVKQAKAQYKEALEEFNKPVHDDEIVKEAQNGDNMEEGKPSCSGDSQRVLGVFVGNLPPTVQVWEVEIIFQKFGKIVKVSTPKRNKGGDSAWAIVQYEKSDDAEKAIENLDYSMMEGRTLMVKWKTEKEKLFCQVCGLYCTSKKGLNEHFFQKHKKDEIKDNGSKELATSDGITSVYVGNLPPTATCNDIQEKFKQFGKLTNVGIPKVSVENDYVWTIIDFKDEGDAEKAIAALDSKLMGGRKLEVKLKMKNVKYFCELCEIYCTCRVNLEKHYVGKQHSAKKLEITQYYDEVTQTKLNFEESEIQPMTKVKSGLKLESTGKLDETRPAKANVSEIFHTKEDKQAVNASSIFLNSRSDAPKPKYSTICKSPTKTHNSSVIHTPLRGRGEGRRTKSGIECSLCKSLFKSTQEFANHCKSSEEHKAASARLEQKMMEEAERERWDDAINNLPEPQDGAIKTGQKISDDSVKVFPENQTSVVNGTKLGRAGSYQGDQNQVLLQQMATQSIMQQQMYPMANAGLPMFNNPFLQYNGFMNNQMMLLNQMNGSANDPMMLLNQMNGSASDPMMLLNQMNGSTSDPMMLLNQMNGSASDPMMLLNQMNGPASNPMMLLNQMKQIPQQTDLIKKAERMALGQMQDTIYKHASEIPKPNIETLKNAEAEREMYMKALTQRQTELQLQQMYYENKRLAAQMDLNVNIEQMKQLSEMEKQKKETMFLQQVEIGRHEELRKAKLKECLENPLFNAEMSGQINENPPYSAMKSGQINENGWNAHEDNNEIFNSEDEEEDAKIQDTLPLL